MYTLDYRHSYSMLQNYIHSFNYRVLILKSKKGKVAFMIAATAIAKNCKKWLFYKVLYLVRHLKFWKKVETF